MTATEMIPAVGAMARYVDEFTFRLTRRVASIIVVRL